MRVPSTGFGGRSTADLFTATNRTTGLDSISSGPSPPDRRLLGAGVDLDTTRKNKYGCKKYVFPLEKVGSQLDYDSTRITNELLLYCRFP